MKNIVFGLLLASASLSFVANEVAQEAPVAEDRTVEQVAPVSGEQTPAAPVDQEQQDPVAAPAAE